MSVLWFVFLACCNDTAFNCDIYGNKNSLILSETILSQQDIVLMSSPHQDFDCMPSELYNKRSGIANNLLAMWILKKETTRFGHSQTDLIQSPLYLLHCTIDGIIADKGCSHWRAQTQWEIAPYWSKSSLLKQVTHRKAFLLTNHFIQPFFFCRFPFKNSQLLE